MTAVPTAPAATDTIAVLDPSTGEEIGAIPAGDAAAADAAVRAARAAQPGWARRPAAERGELLKAAAARARAHADELAALVSRENGRPLDESRGGVGAGIGAIEQYAGLGPLHRGRSLNGAPNATDLMVHEPRGVAALLVPWNDPIAIAGGQLGACLVTGNTVVLKPSEKTPLSTIRLVELLGLPAGVLELLLGDERAGGPLAAHPEVDLVIHTGSIATGRELAAACAGDLRKALLELGGKDPLLVEPGGAPAGRQAPARRRRGRRSGVGGRAARRGRVRQRRPALHVGRADLRPRGGRRAVRRRAHGAGARQHDRPAHRRAPARDRPPQRDRGARRGRRARDGRRARRRARLLLPADRADGLHARDGGHA